MFELTLPLGRIGIIFGDVTGEKRVQGKVCIGGLGATLCVQPKIRVNVRKVSNKRITIPNLRDWSFPRSIIVAHRELRSRHAAKRGDVFISPEHHAGEVCLN